MKAKAGPGTEESGIPCNAYNALSSGDKAEQRTPDGRSRAAGNWAAGGDVERLECGLLKRRDVRAGTRSGRRGPPLRLTRVRRRDDRLTPSGGRRRRVRGGPGPWLLPDELMGFLTTRVDVPHRGRAAGSPRGLRQHGRAASPGQDTPGGRAALSPPSAVGEPPPFRLDEAPLHRAAIRPPLRRAPTTPPAPARPRTDAPVQPLAWPGQRRSLPRFASASPYDTLAVRHEATVLVAAINEWL